MQKTKKQHYVPQFLLKNFCCDNKQQLWVYDKKLNKHFSANILNIAQENGFYNLNTTKGEFRLEETYAKIEGNVAPLIAKMIETESITWLTDDNMWHLIEFIVAQFYRTPQYINRMKQELQTNPEPTIDYVDNETNTVVKSIKVTDIDIDDNFARVIAYNSLYEALHNDNLLSCFNDMDWMLFRVPEGETFITSDIGIAMTNYLFGYRQDVHGFELPYTKILLPISSKFMLALWNKENLDEQKKIITQLMMQDVPIAISPIFKASVTGEACVYPKRTVKECNDLFYRLAERFVFSSDCNQM